MKILPVRVSLHKTCTIKECDLCGRTIPISTPENPSEHWKVKGGISKIEPRIICCACHAIFGFQTDGWESASDGKNQLTAMQPEKGLSHE